MAAVFVDTWFFVAHLHKFDPSHQAALRLAHAYRDATFVTHDGVFTEVLTFFSGQGAFWRNAAVDIVRDAMLASKYKVVPQTRYLFEHALDLYARRADKEYSLVDCTSMHVMLKRDITHVLTNDHHFRQEGFVVLSDVR